MNAAVPVVITPTRNREPIWLRASGLSELFDCATRWEAKVLGGMKSPTFGRSHLGSAIHWGTAVYDQQRLEPDGIPDTEAAVDQFLQYLRADEGVHWVDIPKAKAEIIGVQLVTKYCLEVSPVFEWVKVESACEPLYIDMPNGLTFEVTGHVDRVRYKDGRFGVADFKSGYRIIAADGSLDVAKHGVQLAVYELLEIMASKIIGEEMTLPALIVGFPTTGEPRIEWEEVENPRSLLFGDGGDHEGYLLAAAKIIEHNLFYGNPRSMLCTDRYCPIYNDCFYRRGTHGR